LYDAEKLPKLCAIRMPDLRRRVISYFSTAACLYDHPDNKEAQKQREHASHPFATLFPIRLSQHDSLLP
jgi:hypothetical protein